MSRFEIALGLAVATAFLLGCTPVPIVSTPVGQAAAAGSATTITQVEAPIPSATLLPPPMPTATTLPTATPSAPIMPTPTVRPTASPTSWSPNFAIPCVNEVERLEKPFPGMLDLEDSRTFFDGNFVYLAVQSYLGLVDTSIPTKPKFYGFWELPQSSPITDVLAYNGAIYASSGSTIYILNPNSDCRLSVITRLEVPFNVTRMEVEGDRLYVGGTSEEQNKEQLAIFTFQPPTHFEQTGLLDLGEKWVTWSVQQNEVFLLNKVDLSVIDVSDPIKPVERPINLALDVEEFGYTLPPQMIDNSLYYFSFLDGLNAIHQLEQAVPKIQVTPKEYALDSVTQAVSNIFQIDRDYIFVADNWCDVECTSVVNIIDRESFEPLARMGLYPHYPVYTYVEVTSELVYAFSNDDLLVIDLSDLEHPSIIWRVPLTI